MKTRYLTVSEAYQSLFKQLKKYAQNRLAQKEDAEDAVQDAFTKTIEYQVRTGKTEVSKFILYRETARACRRLNERTHNNTPTDAEQIQKLSSPKTGRKTPIFNNETTNSDDD